MAVSSAEYLENIARGYVVQALKLERQGEYGKAAKYYRKASSVLRKLVQLYPDMGLAHVYKEWIVSYERRAKELEAMDREGLRVGGGDNPQQVAAEVENMIVKEKSGVTFDDIADLEEAKEAIKEAIIYPSRRPDLFPLGWPKGILLFGPPGCGKTLLAAAVANEIDGYFIEVDSASIMSKWLGEAEKKVSAIFKKARELAATGKPVIIFMDEVDSLLGHFSNEVGGEVRVRNQFLKEMDGLNSKVDNKEFVYVIAATNKPWRLDIGFIRRFQKRIYVPLPNREARIKLFKLFTRKIKLAPDVDLEELTRRTEGYTGHDIQQIVIRAHLRTVKELFQKTGGKGEARPVTMQDFLEAIEVIRPSVAPGVLSAYESWYEKYKAV